MTTPWGKADHVSPIIPGILNVNTPSHGGIKLDAKRNAQVPDYMKTDDDRRAGWYEEDCAWSIPFVVFETEMLFSGDKYAVQSITSGQHKRTLANWYPDEYQKFFDVTLKPEESYILREREFRNETRDRYVVVAAWGDWHEKVPTGFVGCFAVRGGRLENGQYASNDHKWFLVPDEEYRIPFVIDEARHRKIPSLEECGTKVSPTLDLKEVAA